MVRRNECLNMVELKKFWTRTFSLYSCNVKTDSSPLFNDTLEACCTLAITSNGSDFLKQLFLVIVKIFQY
jgi:hypothetical protein